MAIQVDTFRGISVGDRVMVRFTHTSAPGRVIGIIKGDGDYATFQVKMDRSGKGISAGDDRVAKKETET